MGFLPSFTCTHPQALRGRGWRKERCLLPSVTPSLHPLLVRFIISSTFSLFSMLLIFPPLPPSFVCLPTLSIYRLSLSVIILCTPILLYYFSFVLHPTFFCSYPTILPPSVFYLSRHLAFLHSPLFCTSSSLSPLFSILHSIYPSTVLSFPSC